MIAGYSGGLPGWVVIIAVAIAGLILFNHFWLKIPVFPYDRVLSAVSEDGRIWKKEAGIRIDVGGKSRAAQVYSPHVVAIELGYRMYYRSGSHASVIASAVSIDGIDWEAEAGERVGLGGPLNLGRVEGPFFLQVPDDDARLYYSGFGPLGWSIYCRTSKDGIDWHGERQWSLSAKHGIAGQAKSPCILIRDGDFRIYCEINSGSVSEIWTAVSADGFHWCDLRRCEGLAESSARVGFPFVIEQADGTLRMYHDESLSSTILGTQISTAVSPDGVGWTTEGTVIEPGGLYDRCGAFGGKAIACPEGFRLYYGGFWERHWSQPHTLWTYRSRPTT